MARKKRHWFGFLAFLLAVYAVVGILVLPRVLRPQLEKWLRSELGRPVFIGRVQMNPFDLSVLLDRVEVRTADGTGALLRWNRLLVDFDAIGSFSKDWLLSEVRLDGLQAGVEVASDGTLNFSDILDRIERNHPALPVPKRTRPWRIGRLDVAQARVDFIDRSRGEVFHTTVGPANFTVLQFRTSGGQGAPLRLDAITESGEKLTWLGTLRVKPLTSNGELRLENINLPKYAPYLESRLNALVASGQINLSGSYDLSLFPDDRRFQVSDGAVQLKQVRLTERAGGDAIVDLPLAEIAELNADIFKRWLQVKSVQIKGGGVDVRRQPGGALNLLSLLAPPRDPQVGVVAPPTPAGQTPAEKPFNFRVQEIAVRGFHLTWDDVSGPRPIHFEASDVAATVKDITTAEGAPFPVEVALTWRPQGSVKVSGQVVLRPLRADLDVDVADFALVPLGAYLERGYTTRLARGQGSVKGHVTLSRAENDNLQVAFTADGSVDDFATTDIDGGELAGFAGLSFRGVRYDKAARLALTLGDLKLRNPYARAVLDRDRKLNFLNLRIPSIRPPGITLPPAEPLPKSQDEPLADISVGSATIEGGDLTLADRSTTPAVNLTLQQFGGTLHNLSARNPAGGEVNLRGVLNGSPVTVTGRLSPFQKNPLAVVKLQTEAVDLIPVAPYVGKYAGFELERGRISVDNTTKLIEQRLDMQNTVRLEQIALGRATESPDAVNAPVRLGLALLKDAQGNIQLDIPVQGSVSDPQFNVSRMVGQVITNVISKAAASPFALIGSMFGGGGEELAQQEFSPGGTNLTEESLRRLDTVRRALMARPELHLDVEGGYDVIKDTHALKRIRFAEQLKQRVWDERARITNSRDVDRAPVTANDRAVMIRRMFDETFPVLARFSKPLPPAPDVEQEPEPEVQSAAGEPETETDRRNLFERARDVATLKALREKRTTRKGTVEAPVPVVAPKPMITATELPLEEMATRLAERNAISPEDLRGLAAARAEKVRQVLTASGEIPPDRVTTGKSGDVTAASAPRATLHLR